jgi:hypothetical protein
MTHDRITHARFEIREPGFAETRVVGDTAKEFTRSARAMRDRYRFISYGELVSLVEVAIPFHELKTKLLGEE